MADKNNTEDRSRLLIKTNDNVIYDASDTCICCGAYLPEGYGMVCYECLRKEREKSI